MKYFDSDDVTRILGCSIDNDSIRKCGGLSCGRERIDGRWIHYVTKSRFIDWLLEQNKIAATPEENRTIVQQYKLYWPLDGWDQEQFDRAMDRLLLSEPRKRWSDRMKGFNGADISVLEFQSVEKAHRLGARMWQLIIARLSDDGVLARHQRTMTSESFSARVTKESLMCWLLEEKNMPYHVFKDIAEYSDTDYDRLICAISDAEPTREIDEAEGGDGVKYFSGADIAQAERESVDKRRLIGHWDEHLERNATLYRKAIMEDGQPRFYIEKRTLVAWLEFQKNLSKLENKENLYYKLLFYFKGYTDTDFDSFRNRIMAMNPTRELPEGRE